VGGLTACEEVGIQVSLVGDSLVLKELSVLASSSQ
jgi:hypothetical protein